MDLLLSKATMLHLRLSNCKAWLAKYAEDFTAAGFVVEAHNQQKQKQKTHQTHNIGESESAHLL